MAELVFHPEKVSDIDAFLKICPFHALEYTNGVLSANAGCKMCKLCLKKGPVGSVELTEDALPVLDKSQWQGICVFAEQIRGELHPVVFELIGKARELADVIHQKVYCIMMGQDLRRNAEELLHYGVDEVYTYDAEALKHFSMEPYTAVFTHWINRVKPCAILVGATPVGRQLAPRVAARFHTGLTADCTVLEMKENTDLQQIRPAFGGNIMAQIHTPNHRPQMATVRYKVMEAAPRRDTAAGVIIDCDPSEVDLSSRVQVLQVEDKPAVDSIENADVIVVAGRGFKKKEDLALLEPLAKRLGAKIACTRPLVEAGWMDAKHQIGLSGRTVRPKLIITFGVSGAVQFTAGMNHADCIYAVNKDENAPIFKTAHYAVIGDLYEVIPALLKELGE